MWKWAIKFDKAFDIPTYRVKVDGLIIGTIRRADPEWSWEVTFPGQAMPKWCKGTRPSRGECQEAVRSAFQALTDGLSQEEARQRILGGMYRI